jgi:hypothetical protein
MRKLRTFSLQDIPWKEFDPEKLPWEDQWVHVSVMQTRGKRQVFVNGKEAKLQLFFDMSLSPKMKAHKGG